MLGAGAWVWVWEGCQGKTGLKLRAWSTMVLARFCPIQAVSGLTHTSHLYIYTCTCTRVSSRTLQPRPSLTLHRPIKAISVLSELTRQLSITQFQALQMQVRRGRGSRP